MAAAGCGSRGSSWDVIRGAQPVGLALRTARAGRCPARRRVRAGECHRVSLCRPRRRGHYPGPVYRCVGCKKGPERFASKREPGPLPTRAAARSRDPHRRRWRLLPAGCRTLGHRLAAVDRHQAAQPGGGLLGGGAGPSLPGCRRGRCLSAGAGGNLVAPAAARRRIRPGPGRNRDAGKGPPPILRRGADAGRGLAHGRRTAPRARDLDPSSGRDARRSGCGGASR